MKKLLLILNPCAGKRKGSKYLSQIESIFHQAGYHVTVHVTTGPGEAVDVLGKMDPETDLVVCCGGDGTFNETVNGLLRHQLHTPVGYIPCGSTNDFASSLHLPKHVLDAAQVIAQGTAAPYDAGQANDRYFSYVASFGAFTRSSYATKQKFKNKFGFLAYACNGAVEVFRIRSIPMQLEADGEVIEGRFLFGAVSNSTRMGRVLKLDPQQVDFSDGKLELRAASNEIGEGSAELPVEFSGDPLTASFNPSFLADPLRFADCEIMTFKMNDGFSPVAIDGGDGFLYVIMPMRH